MRSIFYFFILAPLYSLIFISCSKSADPSPARIDSLPPKVDSAVFTPINKWQCIIDGKAYSGVIDTSFMQVLSTPSGIDSVIIATGTSTDKKAHIHFKVAMNRRQFAATGVNQQGNTFLVFDTSTFNRLSSYIAGQPAINYKIDTFKNSNLAISFTGTLTDRNSQTHSLSGQFSSTLLTGNREPNKFYCLLDSVKRYGYFTNATFSANTILLNGLDYFDQPYKNFRLTIRTGATIKPGIYNSRDGDVSIRLIAAGQSGAYFYVDDSTGSMTVTIQSVVGNVVKGSFSGTNSLFQRVEAGSFVCSISNYTPQVEAADRWQFGAWVSPVFSDYESFAGNILSASKTTSNGRNYLTVRGESDNGKSIFKIVLSSTFPFARGVYVVNGFPDHVLDSLYFQSGIKTWNGTRPHLWAYSTTNALASSSGTSVYIDSITNSKVSGTFFNYISNNLEDFNWGSSAEREIHKARFTATF